MAGKRKAGSGGGRSRPPARKTAASAPAGAAKKAPNGKNGKNGHAHDAGHATASPRRCAPAAPRSAGCSLYLLLIGLVGMLVAAGGFAYLYKTTKLPDPNTDFETNTSFVYYDDGKTELGQYAKQNRDSISYDEMPQDVKDAVVAAENRTFWSDSGIDYKGIVRAVFNNASGNATQGASTITQQYIKILYLTQERSYTRKLKEAILSLKLGRTTSKQEILEGYLNTIYFGRGAYGIQAAAIAYFDKTAAELSLKESAALASIINNPNNFDPANGKDSKIALRERYAYVLDGMADADKISADEAEQAAKRLPKFEPEKAESTYGGQKGHVLTMVKSELLKLKDDESGEPLLTEDEIDGGGLRVTTTFTEKAMDAAEEGVNEVRPRGPDPRQGAAHRRGQRGRRHGGGQGHLRRPGLPRVTDQLGGGRRHGRLDAQAVRAGRRHQGGLLAQGHLRRQLALRAAGRHRRDREPGRHELRLGGQPDQGHRGLHQHGVRRPHHLHPRRPAEGHGDDERDGDPARRRRRARTPTASPTTAPGLEPFPGIALGSATVSPINMANGYATIANGGRFHAPYIIEEVVNKDGEVIYDHSVSDAQVIDQDQGADIAADVTYAMQQVVESGSGFEAAALGRPVAGKTGTATVSQRRRLVVVVHGIHAATGYVGDVRPRQGHRQARRLAAGFVRWS